MAQRFTRFENGEGLPGDPEITLFTHLTVQEIAPFINAVAVEDCAYQVPAFVFHDRATWVPFDGPFLDHMRPFLVIDGTPDEYGTYRVRTMALDEATAFVAELIANEAVV